jgi:GT2 family glycosyltransferase
MGVASSTAELILFIDDDVRPAPDLVQVHVERLLREPGKPVVFGPLSRPPGWNASAWTDWEAATLESEYRRMLAGDYQPTWRQFFTGNALLRRRDFEEAGGFVEELSRAEDIELGLRLHHIGCHFVFNSEARGWHHSARSRSAWLSIPRKYARADLMIAQLHPEIPYLDILRREHRRRNPMLRAAMELASTGWTATALTSAGTAMGQIAHAVGLTSWSRALLSAAYACQYQKEMATARAEV